MIGLLLMCIPYFKEYRMKSGVIASVDMMTVTGKFCVHPDIWNNAFKKACRFSLGWDEWISAKMCSYRYQYKFTCYDGCTFWVGIGFNSYQDSWTDTANHWRIEFNPNKVFKSAEFLHVYSVLLGFSRTRIDGINNKHLVDADYLKLVECTRFDLAVDYPVPRSSCFLVKDLRTYSEHTNSIEDRTQYLGQRSNHGFVKLYNKQIESKLPIPFTRLELTVDYKQRMWRDVEKIFPKVYVVEKYQLEFDALKLTDTDRFILFACLENPDSMKMLARRKKEKIECILAKYTRFLEIDKKAHAHILTVLDDFVNPYFVADMMGEYGKHWLQTERIFNWGFVENCVEGEK